MNKKKHIKSVILEFDKIINFLFDEYDLDISLPIEKCLSNESIKDIVLTEESTILDSLDSIYYKNTKDLFHELKKIEKLGSPKLHYYKDNLYNFKTTYLSRIKEFLEGISTIKYIQYLVDIEGLILELGEPKLTIDGANIIFRYPFNIDDIYNCVQFIKSEFENMKIEALSCVVVLRKTKNEIYIPNKYKDYYFPKCFEDALDDLEIKTLFKSKVVEVIIDGEFQSLYYFSAYEYMNNKTNKPYCYIYIKDKRLCDLEKSKLINKLLKLQDNLEAGI